MRAVNAERLLVRGNAPKQTVSFRPPSAVDGLVPLEHGNKASDLAGSSLRLLHGTYAVEDRVPVCTREGREERCSCGTFIERGLQVGWDCCRARRFIGSLPTAICLRSLNVGQSTRANSTRFE